ncbi:MAG: WYL domain-containing protein [Synechococcaceae cyanobacterium SM2_3_1]|nr:WYL domain-containing protein [Synechococcaceae cyanobacterium SM2_3_1]
MGNNDSNASSIGDSLLKIPPKIRVTVRGMNDVKWWVLGYAKGSVVRDPPELVAMVKEELRRMIQRYREVGHGSGFTSADGL